MPSPRHTTVQMEMLDMIARFDMDDEDLMLLRAEGVKSPSCFRRIKDVDDLSLPSGAYQLLLSLAPPHIHSMEYLMHLKQYRRRPRVRRQTVSHALLFPLARFSITLRSLEVVSFSAGKGFVKDGGISGR